MSVVTETALNQSLLEPIGVGAYPRLFRWTRDNYNKLAEHGLLRGKRVELINGEIINMSPMKSAHATAIRLLCDLLRGVFAKGFIVDSQLPLAIGSMDEPEPDVAVVLGHVRDFIDSHPQSATLLIEVSETTLKFDREVKGSLYARAAIEDYWILNLKERCLEVYRRPVEVKKGKFQYSEILKISEGESVSPLAKPKSKIKIADMLP